ncbi:MAG: isocitrate lyase/phosphoenolpyruvate mutase family protein [Tannerella sp.]|jgi:2-methylisocitrate lyase-like PEP mutase family enzyme|nr:isocitrate lyase/phosphoenolpyruvate mutase family protein [Tannerella sp.]
MSTSTFRQLHENEYPFILGNIWDAQSARLAQDSGYRAVGTSSTAISNMLGYEDGECLSFDEVSFIVERITKRISIPLSVDIEGGYSRNADEINRNIQKLIDLGVAGINIEDSVVVNGSRTQIGISDFGNILSGIRKNLNAQQSDLFVNARIDSYLLGRSDALGDAAERVIMAEKCGANGVFLPGISKAEDIRRIVSSTKLPLNAYALPGVPSYEELARLGVKRISSGGALQAKTYAYAEKLFKSIIKSQRFEELF